ELQQPQNGIFEQFEQIKILYPDIAGSPRFALDTLGQYYIANTAYTIPHKDLFLLAVLNSKPVHIFYDTISSQIRGGYYRFIYQYVSQIPIPDAPDDLRQQIASLAQ